MYFSFYDSDLHNVSCQDNFPPKGNLIRAIYHMRIISFLHTIISVTPEKIIDTFFVSCPTIKHFGMLNKWILPYRNTISALTNLSGKEDSEIKLRHMTP